MDIEIMTILKVIENYELNRTQNLIVGYKPTQEPCTSNVPFNKCTTLTTKHIINCFPYIIKPPKIRITWSKVSDKPFQSQNQYINLTWNTETPITTARKSLQKSTKKKKKKIDLQLSNNKNLTEKGKYNNSKLINNQIQHVRTNLITLLTELLDKTQTHKPNYNKHIKFTKQY